MKYFLLIISFFLLSCGNKKVLQLPEISTSEITEINDVSHAYLFYDETKKDSLELNRKNLISTTNWLINVDKRLTLKQAIPHIKFLQDKKDNSSHKNKNAKNYFTCNDLSRKDLGFIEFTEVIFHNETSEKYCSKISEIKLSRNIKHLSFNLNEKITIFNPNFESLTINSTKEDLLIDLKKVDNHKTIIFLNFNENMSFQEYITFRKLLSKADLKYATISSQEFIYN